MGFASPQIKHDENGYTRTSDPDRTLSVFELCEEFKTYFNWQWAQYKDKQASTACGDREIWKWLKRIIELDAEKESELARLRKVIENAPHAGVCDTRWTKGYDSDGNLIPANLPCTCWKRNALEEK